MAYPIMPMVIPESMISLFFRALATVGTKGAEKIKAVEVIIVVSASILKIFENNTWKNNEPAITIATYAAR